MVDPFTEVRMRKTVLFTRASVLLVGWPVWASNGNPGMTSQRANAASADETIVTATEEKVICRTDKETGSRVRARRVGMSAKQWATKLAEERRFVEQGQAQRTFTGVPPAIPGRWLDHTMRNSLLLLTISLALAGQSAQAAPPLAIGGTTARASAGASEDVITTATDEKVICRSYRELGSRVKSRRICMTSKQWAAKIAEERQFLEQRQAQITKSD